MSFRISNVLLFVLMFCEFLGCNSKTLSTSGVKIVELKDYKTIYAFNEKHFDPNEIISPCIIRYDGRSNHLFVYDRKRGKVVELDGSGKVVNEYGRMGRGPGEFQYINNIILTQDYVYLIDNWRFFIHKYNRKGVYISSMDYGSYTTGGQTLLNMLSSVIVGGIHPTDVNNQPFVTQNGEILLPPGRDKMGRTIYELRDWKGNYLSDIGEVPKGSMYLPKGGGDVYLSAIEKHKIPGIFRPRAFPVSDRANPEELFLVYSATGRIAKYDINGRKLWEREIPPTPEVDAITHDYFNRMIKENKSSSQTDIGMLTKYTSGVCSPDGDLYLSTYTDPNNSFAFSKLAEPLWIHQFNSKGEMIRRYKVVSGSKTVLPSIFDIDFNGRRIFVVTSDGEIRAYSF